MRGVGGVELESLLCFRDGEGGDMTGFGMRRQGGW